MNRYDSYKNVDLAWLKEVPSHWEVKRVKRLFYISKDISYIENPVVLSLARDRIKIRDISTNEGQLAESYSRYNKVKKGDLLLNPMDLYSGANCNISHVEGVISPAYINLRANTKLHSKYFDYLFKIQYTSFAFQSVGKGVSLENRWTLSSETLLNYILPIPPLSEQKQIADYLDWKINEIDKLIDVEREKVNQLEIYKQKIIDSLMYSINSTYIPLKVVFNFGKGLNITKDNLGENGIRCVSYGEIHNDFAFSFSSSNSKLKGLEKVKGITISKFAILQKGDFIFVDTSEDLKGCGNFTYLEDSEREVYAGYHTIVGKLKLEINSRYLAYYFESYKWRKQIREMVNGIKVYSITQSILKSSKIQIPKKEVQNQIVEKIDRFMENQEKLISIINEKIDSLISLKQSLISEVVTGKIDVRDIKIPYYEKIDISNEKQEHLEERQV
jgi:TYPE I RESTRICTION-MODIFICATION SYSTEM SPECIFICITY SUBUNIT